MKIIIEIDQYKSQLKAYIKSGDFEQIFDAKKFLGKESSTEFLKLEIKKKFETVFENGKWKELKLIKNVWE